MFDWEEGDRFSFEDSDRFEEDSLCSWISEPESLCNNWRGWKRPNGNPSHAAAHGGHCRTKASEGGQVLPLVELVAREVAAHIPFEVVEHVYPPVPEQLQLRIAFWSFPENEEDIRLYSCLANGSPEEFQRGEHLFKAKATKDLLQIGFHLSATVHTPQSLSVSKGSYNVAVTFDRCRITSCNCTCNSTASWCSHVVAVCLHRIHQPNQVCLRAPVSESLSRLHRDQLQKFAQYLISELPQQILPTAQRLLDELLSSQQTAINTLRGAPDPTAGASAYEQTTWCLDEATLHENIRKILIKLCLPSPIVFSDVNYLSSTAPPAASEWCSLLRPLRGREPEGMWNLLSIVREMFRRADRNSIPLLQILTEEVLACEQILCWWFNTKVSLHTGSGGHGGRGSVHSNTHSSQHACSSLCDEIVVLWRLAALNPALSPQDRRAFFGQLSEWHVKTLERVCKVRATGNGNGTVGGPGGPSVARRSDLEVFPGFKPALEACLLDWTDYPIESVTYAEGGACRWYSPYMHTRLLEHNSREQSGGSGDSVGGDHTSMACRRGRAVDVGSGTHLPERKPTHVLCSTGHHQLFPLVAAAQAAHEASHGGGSNRSSLSSEGFCENENDGGEFVLPTVADCSRAYDAAMNCSSTPKGSATLTPSGLSDLEGAGGEKLSSPDEADSDWSGPRDGAPAGDNGMLRGEERGQSGDECYIYYFNPQAKASATPEKHKGEGKQGDAEKLPVQVKKIEDQFEILFARAEALHAHGHTQEACKLAVRLAEELLVHPPVFEVEGSTSTPQVGKGAGNRRNRRFSPAWHQVSLLASATLAKAAFLCQVLGENQEHHHLAFRIGLFGLEMARPPASTKALEVKLANQEQDLVLLLKKIPLGDAELNDIREKAKALCDHRLQSRGDALLPLMLSSYIFDALVLSKNNTKGAPNPGTKLPSDEMLGFEAAVAALGLKANVSEAEHPLLCEGTRRQRGDLSITLLVVYKDDQEKLAKIMDKLLDKEVHQMYKSPPPSFYYSSSTPPMASTPSTADSMAATPRSSGQADDQGSSAGSLAGSSSSNGNGSGKGGHAGQDGGADKEVSHEPGEDYGAGGTGECLGAHADGQPPPGGQTTMPEHGNGARAKVSHRHGSRFSGDTGDRSEGASSPGWEEDFKAWEAKFRCTNFRTTKKHSAGMASIDSSAPETTSSDNSPTVVRRSTWGRPCGPGSDSGSSGESSDSVVSSSSGDKATRTKPRDADSPPPALALCAASSSNSRFPGSLVGEASRGVSGVRPGPPPKPPSRLKGKRACPSLPNQPSEASAHFMFELAKTVLTKAGGNSSTAVLFTQPSASQNHRGPHRALHMCAFQIGLYALGLHNAVSPNWLSRTYSSHVSWITGQAMEIGSSALMFLMDTWEGHLTPPEVASLADKASRGRDPAMVRAAAQLALSCLPHAQALNPNEIQRALLQCKEQSPSLLERACLAVESAAKDGGVCPEVLFDVARRWYDLYEESQQGIGDPPVVQDGGPLDANLQVSLAAPMGPSVPTSESGAPETPPLFVVEGLAPTQPQLSVVPPLSYPLPYRAPPYPYLGGVHSFHHPHLSVQYHPAYLPGPPAYHYPTLGNHAQFYAATTAARHVPPPPPPVYTHQMIGVHMAPVARAVLPMAPPPPAPPPTAVGQAHQVQNSISQLNQTQLNYLLSAYRVGLLAMETLARRVHDDRPQAKYARNPPYGEDVKWLLRVAKKLGTSYLQESCTCTVNSVASPFVLYEIVVDTAHHLARSGSTALSVPLRSHVLTPLIPLIQKCQQMFIACTHTKMYHITPAEYDEFISILRNAREAFLLTPGGMAQFMELVQSLRRSKSCKKELWQRITNAVATNPPTI
ncbi:zinc finger SWIM domain-containing protein 8 homolog [Ornithodoros turicata]|uniref:zinc finger SWIM domain-containing protein 8 homolog n=1 Tax=Ornithodoros turicata TaxID=34597 RepID=UPI00313880BA